PFPTRRSSDLIPGATGSHHFNGAAGKTEGHRPERMSPRIIQDLIDRSQDNVFPHHLFLTAQGFWIVIVYSHSNAPSFQAYHRPTTRIPIKISISIKAKRPSF